MVSASEWHCRETRRIIWGDMAACLALHQQVYADGKCGCQAHCASATLTLLSQSEYLAWLRQWRKMRVRPGKTVIDKVDLSRLLDFGRPGVYRVTVEYAEDLVAKHGNEIKYPPVTVSNSISVVVMADSR